MSTKTKVLLASAALLIAFALGRYTVPTKTVTETQSQETKQKATEAQTIADKNTHMDTTVTVHESKDGTKETVTHTVQDSQAATERVVASNQSSQVSTDEKKTTETGQRSRLTIRALAGYSIHDLSTPVYGGSVSRDLLGPISIGAWGLSNGIIGASIGLSF